MRKIVTLIALCMFCASAFAAEVRIEYGSTSDGIYFKLYDPDQFQRWNGQPIRYVILPGTIQESGLVYRYERSPN